MSFDVSRLRAIASNLEDRIATTVITHVVFSGLCFFFGSFLMNDPSYVDRIVFGFVGVMFGRLFGTISKHDLEERRTLISSYLALYDLANKTPETRPAPAQTEPVNEAVAKVEIPAQPKLPEIPSVAAPEDVKEALKAGKAKGKPTRLPPKRKAKTVPPAQA